jgi:hypothetical protein
VFRRLAELRVIGGVRATCAKNGGVAEVVYPKWCEVRPLYHLFEDPAKVTTQCHGVVTRFHRPERRPFE